MTGELHVQNLGKSYRKWGSEWRRIASWFIPTIKPTEEHWVLKDINFAISPGESIGIIGQNGAGKSTLLKLITGTTAPTQGKVHLTGRVAAILELGMGFNPDMTGRQNAYHSAGLMGYNYADIERIMPEIEAFAEIGEYFDQPIRIYSTGMQARVAFSVATAFKPDLLIVDEVLSVGDAYFQAKCYEKIAAYKKQGMTLLLVTHTMNDLLKHCARALFIRDGHLALDGSPRDASNLYFDNLFKKHSLKNQMTHYEDKSSSLSQWLHDTEEKFHTRVGYRKEEHRWGNGGAYILDYLIQINDKPYPTVIESGAHTEFYFKVRFDADYTDITPGFLIKTHDGLFLYGTNSFSATKGNLIINATAGETRVFAFALPMILNTGHYLLSFGIAIGPKGALEPLDRRYDAVLITVECLNGFWGLADLQATFKADNNKKDVIS